MGQELGYSGGYEPNLGTEGGTEGDTKTEDDSLVMAVHSQLVYLIKYGTTERVQLSAIDLALEFLRDLDLTDVEAACPDDEDLS